MQVFCAQSGVADVVPTAVRRSIGDDAPPSKTRFRVYASRTLGSQQTLCRNARRVLAGAARLQLHVRKVTFGALHCDVSDSRPDEMSSDQFRLQHCTLHPS